MELPQPPKSLRRQGLMKSLGILLLGIAGMVTSVTTGVALDTVRDSQSESQCRSTLANDTARLEGMINTKGWTALLKARSGATPEQNAAVAEELERLVGRWEQAQARRDNASEICED